MIELELLRTNCNWNAAEKDIKNDFVVRDNRVYRLLLNGKQKLVVPKAAR